MAKAPIYSQGDTVYLKDSAALGFLEAYIIKTITHRADGIIFYNLATHLKPPTANMTIGDRNTGRTISSIVFFENELILYCDALDLSIQNTQKQLSKLLSQQVAHGCIDEGTG